MKTNKLVTLLTIAAALAFVTTGCKHRPTVLTKLPNSGYKVGSEGPAGLDNGNPLPPTDTVGTGGGEAADPSLFEGMLQDRAALAAHTVHFEYDSATVKKAEKPHVAAVADALKSDSSAKLLIEGHCDERGTEEYNRSLGERRALALREALAKAGVSPDRIRTLSYGEDKPAAVGHDEASYKQNRRGEFVLLHPKQ